MTRPPKMQRTAALRAYLAASYGIGLLADRHLRKRLARGKEHPTRWIEKQARGMAPRPDGTLIWLHAVGLGEVLSLRGLIAQTTKLRPGVSFLVTSSTKASADVFAKHAPPRTVHQFLPLDAPQYRRRFLDHFRPDLCVWVEQDLWPGMVSDLANRGVPQCVVAARMNTASLAKHTKAAGLYRSLYQTMAFVTAQDPLTADHLASLGANADVTGALKPSAPALHFDQTEASALRLQIGERLTWAVAPAHPADIGLAVAAHAQIRETHPDALLIIAPRFPDRIDGGDWPKRSQGRAPAPTDPIWLCDTFGELGLVYKLSRAVLIGGTFSDIEGHNPWEAVAQSVAILHGPRTANFAIDFATLATHDASVSVATPTEIEAAVLAGNQAVTIANATACRARAGAATQALAQRLADLLEP